MGAVNYFTSDYITMGVPLLYSCDLENDPDFMEEVRAEVKEYGGTVEEAIGNYISGCYADDLDNVKIILSRFSFWYYHVTIKPGYYEGFTLDIESNFPISFDSWEDRRKAQKEITQLKRFLLECAGVGLVACYPGWCTGYEDYKGTCKAIEAAVKEMREEVKSVPPWKQYERETA